MLHEESPQAEPLPGNIDAVCDLVGGMLME